MANNQYTFTISEDHIQDVLRATAEQVVAALEACGAQAVTYAINNITEQGAVDTGNLRNSLTFQMENENTVQIGTAVEYAPYVEMGTGIYASDGTGRKTPWVYKDGEGNWHTTKGSRPKPYLKPAMADHIDEYRQIIEKVLSGN